MARSGPPRGRASRVAVLVIAAVAAGLGAWLGAWWVPFVLGLGTGAAGTLGTGAAGTLGAAGQARPVLPRGSVASATAGAAAGWGFLLWLPALRGEPAGATARTIAALAGVPPHAAVAVAAILLLAVLQVLAGAWLGRAAMPRRAVS